MSLVPTAYTFTNNTNINSIVVDETYQYIGSGSKIYKYTNGTLISTSTLSGGVTQLSLLNNKLWVLSSSNQRVYQYDVNSLGGTPSPLSTTALTGGGTYVGLCFDGTNTWATNVDQNTLYKISPSGTLLNTYGPGQYPAGVYSDGTNVYVGSSIGLRRFNIASDSIVTNNVTIQYAYSICKDGDGNIWATKPGSGIYKCDPITLETLYQTSISNCGYIVYASFINSIIVYCNYQNSTNTISTINVGNNVVSNITNASFSFNSVGVSTKQYTVLSVNSSKIYMIQSNNQYFSLGPVPTITSVSIPSTPVNKVIITGTNFTSTNAGGVVFNPSTPSSVTPSFTIDSNTQITCTVTSVFLINSVSVTNTSGTVSFSGSPLPAYTNVAPSITGVNFSNLGQVIITGTNLLNIPGASSVSFTSASGNFNPTSISINSAGTQITANVSSLKLVILVSVTDTYSNTASFSGSPLPAYTNIEPSIDTVKVRTPTLGTVIITGNNFLDVATVSFNDGTILPESFMIVNNNKISAIVPDEFIMYNTIVTNSYGTAGIYTPITPYPICFPAGTPIHLDQGIVAIEKVNPRIHTINGKKIIAVTKTITPEDTIVCIEKDTLGTNIPSQKTIVTNFHGIIYNNRLEKAITLVKKVKEGVYTIPYNGEPLYNILMETHELMSVNNMLVETLEPKNLVAKMYNKSYSPSEKYKILKEMELVNNHINNKNKKRISNRK